MSACFQGFPADGLDLLARLGSADKPFFDRHRPTYDRDLAAPAKSFVEAMNDALVERFGPGIVGVAKVNGSISPINNDRRFAPDAAPYKDHLLLRWWEGPCKADSPTLFVRVAPDTTGFATGVVPPSVDRWRAAVAESGAELAAAIDALRDRHPLEVAGAQLKRVPAPYPADHPSAELLRRKGLQCRWSEPTPDSIHSVEYVRWCADRLEDCASVHRWFVQHLGPVQRG